MVFLPLDPYFLQYQLGVARDLDRKDRDKMRDNQEVPVESAEREQDRELIAQLQSETDRLMFTVDLTKARPYEGLSAAKRSLLKRKLKEQIQKQTDADDSAYFKLKVKRFAEAKAAKRLADKTEMERRIGDNEERAKLGLPPITEKQLRLRAQWEAEDAQKIFAAQARTEWAEAKSRVRWRRAKKIGLATLVALAASLGTLAMVHPQTIEAFISNVRLTAANR